MSKLKSIRIRDILTKEILAEQLQKLTINQIAAKYEICRSSVNNLIKEYHLEVPRHCKITKEQLLAVDPNKTQKELAKEFGVAQSYLCRLYKFYGLGYKNIKYHTYYVMWNEFKEYCQVVNPKMYRKMKELEG